MTQRYWIDAEAFPEVLLKVVKANALLESGAAATTGEAAAQVGLSRATFAKYRHHVGVMTDGTPTVMTLVAVLDDRPGVLSQFTQMLSAVRCNVLTVNQSIPAGGVAPVTVCLRSDNMPISSGELLAALHEVDGVRRVTILAGTGGAL